MERPVLVVLEDAELCARERRLWASAEAERRVAAGTARATAIETDAVAEAERSIAQARAASEGRVAAALAAIAAETATLEALDPADRGHPAIIEAAELVVAAVLGERRE